MCVRGKRPPLWGGGSKSKCKIGPLLWGSGEREERDGARRAYSMSASSSKADEGTSEVVTSDGAALEGPVDAP